LKKLEEWQKLAENCRRKKRWRRKGKEKIEI